MLRLSKSVSDESYPVSPQTSAVRKLRIRATPANVADLSQSYLIIKNTINTMLNGQSVVRNVGFGSSVSQSSQWHYPATCQIRTASLSIAGQVVEYNEDLHIRKVNMDVYTKSVEKLRTEANYGAQSFQRLEGRKVVATDATIPVRDNANYLSNFLGDSISPDALTKAAPSYNTTSSVIFLGDIFEFCRAEQLLELAGKEVLIELQFEDRNALLTEFVDYKTDLTTNVAAPRPFPYSTIAIDTANGVVGITKPGPFDPTTYAVGDEVQFRTANTYDNIREFPLYVGQPICLWLNNAAPAVVGSNFFIITGLQLDPASAPTTGRVKITFKAYTLDGANFVRTPANAAITAAEIAANISGPVGAPTVSLAVAISATNDPVLTAAAATVYTNIDAGNNSTYSVQGLELVLSEIPDPKVSGVKQVQFYQYMRDVDAIPTGQTVYQKTFQLDPGCVAVFAMLPCGRLANDQTNMLSINFNTGISTGLSYRNMLDGETLYTRDIAFGTTSDAVDPLYTHRLALAVSSIKLPIENFVQNQTWMSHDGVSCHAMISEPVPLSNQPQQLALRLNFTTNTSARTIYVYKAVLKTVNL
jgi:hypothetical protein